MHQNLSKHQKMSLYSIYSYLFYLCQARSEYYVHSPFVYSLMQNCIRERSIFHIGEASRLSERIKKHLHITDADIKIIDDEHTINSYIKSTTPPTSILIIKKPHSCHSREKLFSTLCQRQDISLSIDTFFNGIIFPVRDMTKEHFVLNYF